MPKSQSGGAAAARSPAPPRPKTRFKVLRALVVLIMIFGATLFLTQLKNVGGFLGGSTAIPNQPSAEIDLQPGPYDPQSLSSGHPDPVTGSPIEQTSVETDAVDPDGYVGVRVRARVRPGRTSGARFAVHFSGANQNHVFSSDSRYSDPNRQVAGVVALPEVDDTADVICFIPYTAFDLKAGTQRLTMLPALFDSANRPMAIGQPVSFTWERGAFYVTRAVYDHSENYNRDPALTVTVRSERRRAVNFSVVARLKDGSGNPYPGRPPFTSVNGERTVTSSNSIGAARIAFATEATPLLIPAGLAPPGSIAEIACYDNQARAWLTRPISIKLP